MLTLTKVARMRGIARKPLLYYKRKQQKLVEAQSQLAAAETSLVKAQSDLRRIRPLAEMNAL